MTIRQIQSQKNFEHAKSLVDDGMTIGEAVKTAKISMGTWYDKNAKLKKSLRANHGKKKHAFVDLPPVHQAPRIAIVITTVDGLKDVLKGLL